jgi:hypothetical protein
MCLFLFLLKLFSFNRAFYSTASSAGASASGATSSAGVVGSVSVSTAGSWPVPSGGVPISSPSIGSFFGSMFFIV